MPELHIGCDVPVVAYWCSSLVVRRAAFGSRAPTGPGFESRAKLTRLQLPPTDPSPFYPIFHFILFYFI